MKICHFSIFTAIMALALSGCAPAGISHDDSTLLLKPIRSWNAQECENFLVNETPSNARRDDQGILAIVFPCTPRMLLVYNWRRYAKHQINIRTFEENTDRQAQTCLGAYFDSRTDRFIDAKGKYVRNFGQLDSLLLIVSLESKSSGLDPLLRSYFTWSGRTDDNIMSDFLNPSFSPEAYPEMNAMKERITLEANRRELASPKYIRNGGGRLGGRKGDLLIMFAVNDVMRTYLESHDSVDIRIDIGDKPITLSIPLSI